MLHLGAVPLFAIAFAVLAARTPVTDADRAAVIVYAVGVLTMFSVSATYHASTRRPRRLSTVLRRLDHGAILLAIAGTYTAVTALAIHGPRRGQLLWPCGCWRRSASRCKC